MGELKRGAIDVAHPGQLADAARELAGFEPSGVPFTPGYNYVDEAGNPMESIPDPGPQPGDMDVPAINSPAHYGAFLRRSAGLLEKDPEGAIPEKFPSSADPITGVPLKPVGNLVHLDDGFAYLDGQLVPLDGMDLARIGGIVVRAFERKMKEDYARLKNVYRLRVPKRKPRAVRKANSKRSKAMPETSGGPPSQPSETP